MPHDVWRHNFDANCYREFIQTNKQSELLVFEGYGYIRHRQPTDGAVVLQNATAESGYAMNKSKLSQFIAIYLIQQILKRGNSAQRRKTEQQWLTRLPDKQFLPPKRHQTDSWPASKEAKESKLCKNWCKCTRTCSKVPESKFDWFLDKLQL